PDLQHRHGGNRAGRVFLGGRIDDVVGADDHRDVGIREIVVHLVHLEHDVVGDLGLGEQHVHVAGHAAGDRVYAETDVYALLAQKPRDLVNRVLRLRHGHAVPTH